MNSYVNVLYYVRAFHNHIFQGFDEFLCEYTLLYDNLSELLLFTNIVNHIRIACGSKTVTLRKLRNIYYKSCFKIPAKTPVTEPILVNLIRDLY